MKKNTKTATKVKTATKQKKKQQKCFGEAIYFEVILMIILIPTVVLFLVPIFQKPLFEKIAHKQSHKIVHVIDDKEAVKIVTDKSVYGTGGQATVSIKNNSGNSIYFEPCEYLNNFEKKIDGVWVGGKRIIENRIYDSNNFRKGNSMTSCNINLPKLSVGTYRAVIEVYYGCQMPGGDMCSDSKTFYSNEFKIVSDCVGCR